MKQAIIYCRISTKAQEGNYSCAMQERECRAYADQHGMTVLRVLTDQASGSTLDRPGLDALRDLAEAHEMDAVLVWSLDRLSRKAAYTAILEDEFKSHKVVVHYLDGVPSDCEDDTSILLSQIKAVIAEDEKRRIRRRLVKGRLEKVQGGQVSGHGSDAPYGYRFEGIKRNRHLVQVPDEIAIVIQIYEWYVAGVQVMEIQRRLVALRVPTPGATRAIKAQDMTATRVRNAMARKGHVDTEHRQNYRAAHYQEWVSNDL